MRAVLIAGPTAAGKSALALALAERLGGIVVNADSQQVYAGWHLLTARPSPEDAARAPHLLYGHVPMREPHSAGDWLRAAAPLLAGPRLPVIVGGTGLFFRALTEGLAEIPPVPAEVRAGAEAALERLGLAGFAAALAARDPATHARLDTANPVRLLRAWEVLEATGRGLAEWHAGTPPPLLARAEVLALRLEPPRAALHARIAARLAGMVRAGVLDEVRAVLAMGLDPGLPAMKAVGAPEFAAHLRGETSLAGALAAAEAATRQYARRQLTWARSRMADWSALAAPDAEAALAALRARGKANTLG